MADKEKHLYYLDELPDYKVESGDPDVRGWALKDNDGQVIGKVDNLLVHKEREQVVYLDVEVDKSIIAANYEPYGRPRKEGVHEFLNREGEDHLIVPIGFVDIDEEHKFVRTEKVNYQTFAETKRIHRGVQIERGYEEIVLGSYERQNKSESTENVGPKKGFEDQSDTSYMDNFYKRKAFDRSPPFRFKL